MFTFALYVATLARKIRGNPPAKSGLSLPLARPAGTIRIIFSCNQRKSDKIYA